MASQSPSTPVKVPTSAANYTAATLDPDLRTHINATLIKEGHVTKIQDTLLHALHSNSTNWPTLIQSHALSLLRSGEVTSFPALLRRVIEDVRQDTALSPSSSTATTNGNGNAKATVNGTSSSAAEENGSAGVNGKKNGDAAAANGTNGSSANTARASLAVPQSVVDDALRVTRECLEAVCDLDESGA